MKRVIITAVTLSLLTGLSACGHHTNPPPTNTASSQPPAHILDRSEDEIFTEAEKTARAVFESMATWESNPTEELPKEIYRYTEANYRQAIIDFAKAYRDGGFRTKSPQPPLITVAKDNPFIPKPGSVAIQVCREAPAGTYVESKGRDPEAAGRGVAYDRITLAEDMGHLVITAGNREERNSCPFPSD